MALTAPTIGEVVLLEYIVNKETPTELVLHLFKNNPTISDATVYGDLTEATEAGYAAITLTGTDWTVADVGGLGTATYAEQTFTFTTAASIYGYYVTSTTASELLWLEKFSGAPFTLPSGGGSIGISPRITLE
ncbi:MAG: hypothetical protein DWQ19_11775 [Crenarchaeota archaeon]|nr:MAG: hypothetical protein DWQ19_11775 [Thermoproteota archaeon]